MATGQSEQLKQFQELAEAVLHVTERQERLTERQERLKEHAEACAAGFERLESRVDGRQRSRESAIDEAYRRLSGRVDELTEKVRWASRSWTWKPLMWGAFGAVEEETTLQALCVEALSQLVAERRGGSGRKPSPFPEGKISPERPQGQV